MSDEKHGGGFGERVAELQHPAQSRRVVFVLPLGDEFISRVEDDEIDPQPLHLGDEGGGMLAQSARRAA